ncbi:hypothetical protein HO133_009533 [Letharia lupina]|uniref:Uncharacterized protein n=1 Tax=Letharia lupina TaxID=560253 RepID=A0A8H6CL81_9LECA|nr:uncharacterized protein HO133_009533 [Letharia lupina]KAF6225533.1 hypothetical protein HO133_009533 [Letharia lupina]
MMRLFLLSSLFSTALSIVLPAERDTVAFEVAGRDLVERAGSHSTSVTMDPTRLSYGNLKPADVMQHLSGPCNDQLTGCDYENTGSLNIPSEMYVDATTIPIAGTIKLNPKGDFTLGNGSQFVDCIVKSVPYGAQCKTQSWNQPTLNPKLPDPPNSVGTASFCTMSNFVECSRTDTASGDSAGYLQVGVSFTADAGSSFDFCSILSLFSGLTGVLGPFFGTAAWACDTGSGGK